MTRRLSPPPVIRWQQFGGRHVGHEERVGVVQRVSEVEHGWVADGQRRQRPRLRPRQPRVIVQLCLAGS